MRILRGALVALAAIALLTTVGVASAQTRCGGLLQPKCPPPPPPPPPPEPVAATLTLFPMNPARRIDTKRDVTFRGTVSGVDNPGGMYIDVHLGVPGYGPKAALKPIVTQVDSDGTFVFEVRPQVTVDVQAVLREDGRATGSSPVSRLTIRSVQNLSLRAVTATRGRFVLTTLGPSVIPLAAHNAKPRAGAGRTGYLYLVAKNGKTALRIGSGRVRDGACPALCKRSAIGFFHISRSIAREKRNFIACARASMFVSIQDAAVSPDCGKTSIKLRKAKAT